MSSDLNLPVNHRIYLDLDVMLPAPVGKLVDASNMFPRAILRAPNKYVSFRVKAITRNSHDIEILAVFIKPFLGNF